MDALTEKDFIVYVSIFGPSDHGKSTLVGKLFANFHRKEFEQYDRSVKSKLGSEYKTDRRYAYVSDRHLSEQIGYVSEKTRKFRGTTQHVHSIPIVIDKKTFLFVDNPGHFDYRKEIYRGLSRGAYGVFVVAINDLYNHLDLFKSMITSSDLSIPEPIREYALPLYIGLKTGMPLACIVFSKMDIIQFNKKIYDDCADVMRQFLEKNLHVQSDKVPIVPLYINATKEEEENLTRAPVSSFSWYDEQTFTGCIVDLVRPLTKQEMPLYIPIQKLYFGIRGHSAVLVGKIVGGTIKEGDLVRVGPFGSAKDCLIDAKVRKIQLDTDEKGEPFTLKQAYSGQVICISLNLDNKYIEELKDKSHFPYIVVSPEARIIQGNVICMAISDNEIATETETIFKYGRFFNILITGKYLPSYFLGFYRDSLGQCGHCFKTVRSLTVTTNEEGKIAGIQPLIMVTEGRKKSLQILSVKLPVLGIGRVKSYSCKIPRDGIGMIDKELLPYTSHAPDGINLSVTGEKYAELEKQFLRLRALRRKGINIGQPTIELNTGEDRH